MEIKPLLTSPYEVKKILNNLNHRPSRKLGQNYLIDSNIRCNHNFSGFT